MSPETLYFAMAVAVVLPLALVLCARVLAERLRAELRLQAAALVSGLQLTIDARVLAAVRGAVDREVLALRQEHAADARIRRQEFESRMLAWQKQLDAEFLSMRIAPGQHSAKSEDPMRSHPTPVAPTMRPPAVRPPAASPAAPTALARSARPPEMQHTPLPRAQASADSPGARRELSDEEADALPPELPGPARPRRPLPAPKKPPFRSL